MKARHEFKTDKEYNDYLRYYFAAQALASGSNAKDSIGKADALIKALNETQP